jgi:hypothetical protein
MKNLCIFQPLCSRTLTVPESSINVTLVGDVRDVQTGPLTQARSAAARFPRRLHFCARTLVRNKVRSLCSSETDRQSKEWIDPVCRRRHAKVHSSIQLDVFGQLIGEACSEDDRIAS